MHELTVGKNDAGQRLDKFLTKTLNLPGGLLYKSIRTKKIKVNRKRAEGNTPLAVGDTVQCFLPDEFFTGKPNEESFRRIKANLDVVYEDENILLVNKPAGVFVHEDENGATDTLITHIQAYLFEKGEYKPDEEQSFAPALCNRIDRNTAGIVIAAKNAEALREMNDIIRERKIEKYYLAAVHGTPSPREATVKGYLLKDEKSNTVRVFDKDPPRGAKAIATAYRVLAEDKATDTSLLEVRLLTGRTHQIRAHMAHIGHPLVGDGKYGVNKTDRERGYKFQALSSYRLVFANGKDGLLGYLDGKEFSIPKKSIPFTKDFL